MTAWVIRGGKYAEREDEALENGFLTIGFGIIKSLDNVQTPNEVAGCLDLSGNETNQQLASRVSQVWAFKDGIKTGDTVVMPRKGPSVLAVGRITGEYTYRPEQPGITAMPEPWSGSTKRCPEVCCPRSCKGR